MLSVVQRAAMGDHVAGDRRWRFIMVKSTALIAGPVAASAPERSMGHPLPLRASISQEPRRCAMSIQR